MSDIVFLRSWVPVTPPALYSPVTTLMQPSEVHALESPLPALAVHRPRRYSRLGRGQSIYCDRGGSL
jgi:hypothetical protein